MSPCATSCTLPCVSFAYKRKATNKDKQGTWLGCKTCNRLVNPTLFQVLQQTFLICTTRITRTNCRTNPITAVYQQLVLHHLIRTFRTITRRIVSRRTPRLRSTCHLVDKGNTLRFAQKAIGQCINNCFVLLLAWNNTVLRAFCGCKTLTLLIDRRTSTAFLL